MKKLFAIILSLSLIIAPIPVVNTAFASGGSITQQIVGIANGIVGAGLMTKCKMATMQPSVMVYMGGSLTYLLGEITTAKKKSSDMSSMSDSVNNLRANMKEGGDYQKKIIQTQLDNENSNLEFIQKRRMFVSATLAIYGVATALAVFEAWRELPTPVGMSITSVAGCSPNPAANQTWVLALGGAYAAIASSGGQPSIGGAAMGAAGAVAMDYVAKEYLPKIMAKLTASSQAAEAPATSGLNSAWVRVAFFGVMTGLVGKIMTELSSEEKKTKDNIAKLQKVLNSLPGEQNAIAEGSTLKPEGINDPQNDSEKDPNKKYALKNLPKTAKLPKVCLGADQSVSEGACAGRKFQIQRIKLDSSLGLNTLQSSSNTAQDFAQAMIDGDIEKAEIMQGSLKAAAVNAGKIKDAFLKKYNDNLASQGKKPVDIDALAKKQMAGMQASFAKNGMDISNVGSGSIADAANIGNAEVSDTKPADGAVGVSPEGIANANAGDAAAIDLSAIDDAGKTGEEGSGLLDPNAEVNKVASLSDGLNGFESNENDISKERDVSIFKQVSNRYFLNYTKLFERKKVDSPMPGPAQ